MFKFKGISSNEMRVVVEEEELFVARSAIRYEAIEIEGRDGAIYDELGYSAVERPIVIQCLDVSKIDDILAWLDGPGELEYKGRKTIARFYAELEPIRNASIRIIDTRFIRDPFWYKADDEYEEVDVDNPFVNNEGNTSSRPIIKLVKTTDDTVTIQINETWITYTFDSEEYVEIDCDAKTVTYKGMNRTRRITIIDGHTTEYVFPYFEPSDNNYAFSVDGECTILLKRKDRWL